MFKPNSIIIIACDRITRSNKGRFLYGSLTSSLWSFDTPVPNRRCLLSDNGRYLADVTIPDDTTIEPGTEFIKTWRMENNGSTTWGEGYHFVFVNGNPMSGPHEVPLPAAGPGQQVEISINQVAPLDAGKHFGDWRVRNPQGEFFGE